MFLTSLMFNLHFVFEMLYTIFHEKSHTILALDISLEEI